MSNKDDIISGAPHCEEIVNKFKNWSINCSVMDTWRTLHENESDFTVRYNLNSALCLLCRSLFL